MDVTLEQIAETLEEVLELHVEQKDNSLTLQYSSDSQQVVEIYFFLTNANQKKRNECEQLVFEFLFNTDFGKRMNFARYSFEDIWCICEKIQKKQLHFGKLQARSINSHEIIMVLYGAIPINKGVIDVEYETFGRGAISNAILELFNEWREIEPFIAGIESATIDVITHEEILDKAVGNC